MEIRPATANDLDSLVEIDGTIESSHYLHLDRTGEGLDVHWRLQQRLLRQKWIDRNRPTDDDQFLLKQVLTGMDEGFVLLAEHEGAKVGLLIAHPAPEFGTMQVADLRIDFDYRRQGLATAMLYQTIAQARTLDLRAVAVESRTNNLPANLLFAKVGFELGGLDTARRSNHDLVKEAATLFWYAPLD